MPKVLFRVISPFNSYQSEKRTLGYDRNCVTVTIAFTNAYVSVAGHHDDITFQNVN